MAKNYRSKKQKDKIRKRESREKTTSSFTFCPVNTAWIKDTQTRLKLPLNKPDHDIFPPTTNAESPLQLSQPVTCKTIPGDGNCFFASLSFIICGHEKHHMLIRQKICRHLVEHGNQLNCYLPLEYHGNINNYLLESKMQQNATWATEVEIFTASHMLRTNIYVYTKSGVHWVWHQHKTITTSENMGIYLYHRNQNHYDVVLTTSNQPILQTFPNSLQSYLTDQIKKESDRQIKRRKIENYNTYTRTKYEKDENYRERKKKKSKETAKKKYRDDKKYRESKTLTERKRYRTNTKYSEKKKKALNEKYRRNINYRQYKKMSSVLKYASDPIFKRKMQILSKVVYQENSAFRQKVKGASKTKYRDNSAFRQKVKSNSKTKYRNNSAFRQKKKSDSKTKYRNNSAFRQKKKSDSKTKYRDNSAFRQKKKSDSKTKYRDNSAFRQKKKSDSKTKYRDNSAFRQKVKSDSKTKYRDNSAFRQKKKSDSKTKYRDNSAFRQKKKSDSKTKYRDNSAFRQKKKSDSKTKYRDNSAFRQKVKSLSKMKYRSDEVFQNAVKSYSRRKYQRFESFRNRLKESSIKKYSTDPLFRWKLKSFLKDKYRNDINWRQKKKLKRNSISISQAINRFHSSIKDVPIYVCTVCIRSLYKSQVMKCHRSKYYEDGVLSEMATECLTGKYVHKCDKQCKSKCEKSQEWICITCHRHLSANKMPKQALCNGLNVEPIPPELKNLNVLERQLVALRIPFMKVLSLPKGGQKGVKGPCINVPSDLNTVTSTLPRPINEAQLVKVKLKRKLQYKGYHQFQWINPTKVQQAVQFLIDHNKWYSDVTLQNQWYNQDDDDMLLCENSQDTSNNDKDESTEKNTGDQDEDTSNNDKDESTEKNTGDQDDKDETTEKNTGDQDEDTSIYDKDETTEKNTGDQDEDTSIYDKDESTEKNTGDQDEDTSNNDKDETTEKNTGDQAEDVTSVNDLPSYPEETCLQPIDLGQEVLDTDGRIFCLAPGENQTPKSVFRENGIDAMAFPHLHPSGQFSFSMDRQLKLTPSKYFNARLFSADTRFATDNQYIFFAQYVTEITNVTSNISIALRKGNNKTQDGKNLTASMLTRPDSLKQILKSDIGYRFLQPVRGTPPYWERTMKDLYAMIRQIGIPTFFLTFSAGETRWDDVISTLLTISQDERQIPDLEWTDKCKLIKENPLMCARLFDHRVKSLFTDLLLSKAQPIGKVVDFFFRTEFQQRGSPHIHCLIWIDGAPRLDEDSDEEVCIFIDKHITCQLPSNSENPELHEIVTSVQMHSKNHTKSCRKHSTTCRFNFPRPPIYQTFIARPELDQPEDNIKEVKVPSTDKADEKSSSARPAKQILKDIWTLVSSDSESETVFEDILKLAGTTYAEYKDCLETVTTANAIFHKRSLKDLWVNNYNKYLLSAWNANMDIQYVTDVYSCVAYILSYISKSEGEMSELLLNTKREALQGNEDAASTMKKIGQVYMHNREISAQEAVYRVCSLKLKDSSRNVTFIPTGSNPLKMSLPINIIRSRNEEDENIWMTTIFDKYYGRPLLPEFNSMCLADFCAKYQMYPYSQKPKSSKLTPSFELQNHLGFAKQKTKGKENVIRYPRFNPQKASEDFYMTLLQLYVPHRSADIKPPGFLKFEDFVRHGTMEDGTKISNIIRTNRQKYEHDTEKLEKALEDIQSGRLNQDAWAQIAPEAEAERLEIEMEKVRDTSEETENLPEFEIFQKDSSPSISQATEFQTPKVSQEEINSSIRQLNGKQQEIFYEVRKWCIDVSLQRNPDPFHIFLTGGAGTGKTHLVRCIYHEANRILSKSASTPDAISVLLTAPTGTAAFNIQGVTVHSAFAISKVIRLPYKPLGESLVNSLRTKYESLRILVIDEISMVDHKLLSYINGRLSQIKQSKKMFGNVALLAVGDFYQLPPVKASPLYRDISSVLPDLWNPVFNVAVLTEIMRQKDDQEFAFLLNRLRTHEKGQPISSSDLSILSSVSVSQTPEKSTNALHIFPTNKEVNAHNEQMIKLVCSHVVISKATDFYKNTLNGQVTQRDEPYSTFASEDLLDIIELGIDARVMLVRNIDTEDGLVNGAFGTITGIEKSPDNIVRAVYVRFDHPQSGKKHLSKLVTKISVPKNSVRISPVEDILHGRNVTRKQLPLKLGWAATIHKVQGMTLKEVVVSLKNTFAAGMAYVALSRVSSLKGLHIIDFDSKVIYASQDITKALQAMQPFLCASRLSSTAQNSTMTLTLHNTEGLLPHKDDITNAEVLDNSHIICFTETWLTKNAYLPTTLLSNFVPICKSRSESYNSKNSLYTSLAMADRGGVAIFVHKDLKFCHRVYATHNLEYAATLIETPINFILVNIYRPPMYPLPTFCKTLDCLLQEIDHKERVPIVVTGDFNDNIFQEPCRVLELFQKYHYIQLVNEMTIASGSCLDLVFVKNFPLNPTCRTIPIYYSFHEFVQLYFI